MQVEHTAELPPDSLTDIAPTVPLTSMTSMASTAPMTPTALQAPPDSAVGRLVPTDDDVLLTPAEVARVFRVNPKTVTRWARSGKLRAIRTLGGHRRFRAADIRVFLESADEEQPTPDAEAG